MRSNTVSDEHSASLDAFNKTKRMRKFLLADNTKCSVLDNHSFSLSVSQNLRIELFWLKLRERRKQKKKEEKQQQQIVNI